MDNRKSLTDEEVEVQTLYTVFLFGSLEWWYDTEQGVQGSIRRKRNNKYQKNVNKYTLRVPKNQHELPSLSRFM